MQDLYLIGAGGHCVSCIDVINAQAKYRIKGIIDVEDKVGTSVLGVPVIGTDSEISGLVSSGVSFLITVGQIKTPQVRKKIYTQLMYLGAELATVVSPRAYVSPHAKLGAGTIVMHDALVNANVFVGKNCILNTKSLLEHDVVVEDHCHISTGAIVNGSCFVGDGSFVGSNSVLKESLRVPGNSVLSAGVFHR